MVDVSSITQSGNPALVGNPLTTAQQYQNLATQAQQYQQNQQAFPLQNQLTQANIAATNQNIQNAQTANTQNQQALHLNRSGAIGGMFMSSLLNGSDSDFTPDNARKLMQQAQATGLATPTEVQPWLSRISDDMSPEQIKNLYRQISTATVHPDVQQQMATPSQTFLQTGQTINPMNTPKPGMPGQNVPVPAGGPIQVTTDPSSNAALVRTYVPGVGWQNIPRSALPGASGVTSPGGTPAAPAAGTPFPAGVRPPGDATTPAPSGGPPSPVAANGYPLSEPEPGTAESIATAKLSSAQAGSALTNTDADRPMKQALLTDILTQASVPGAFSGPDAPAYKTLMARLSQVPGVITDQVRNATSAQDAMEKAMANFQSLQSKSLIGTNAGLAQTIAGSPHMELSKGGLQANVHQIQGTLDYEGAMSKAWQASPLSADPSNFKKFQQDYIATQKDATGNPVQIDPRAFWLSHMEPAEAKVFIDATKDRSQLARNYQYAITQGLIPKPGQ